MFCKERFTIIKISFNQDKYGKLVDNIVTKYKEKPYIFNI